MVIYLSQYESEGICMFYVISIVAGYIAFMYGAFAFCQIIGSIRERAHYFAIIFWSVLTVVLCGLIYFYLTQYIYAVAIGLLISLITVLRTPKIE